MEQWCQAFQPAQAPRGLDARSITPRGALKLGAGAAEEHLRVGSQAEQTGSAPSRISGGSSSLLRVSISFSIQT